LGGEKMYRRVWPSILLTAVVFFALGTLFGARVLSVRTDQNSASITVDKERLETAAQNAAEKTAEAGRKLADKTKDAVQKVEVDVKRRDEAARPTTAGTN